VPTVIGALLPDAVDKSLAWVLKVTQSSHHMAHTPLAAAALSVLAAKCFGPRWATAFGTSYLVHLIGDEVHHGRVPWLLPLSNRRSRKSGQSHSAIFLALEVPSTALLLHIVMSGREKRQPDTSDINPRSK
jgi:LexA-binding, inner membrane-associated putative hydrolase